MVTIKEQLTVYKKFIVKRPTLDHHSYLYSLQPINIGTSQAESLSSYICRLAKAHSVTTQALCAAVVFPRMGERKGWRTLSGENIRAIKRRFFKRAAPALNGMGRFASDWVGVMETLTSITDLQYTTGLVWSHIFSKHSWLRPVRAWCPHCYEEQRETGTVIYDLLLWTLKSVTACARHCNNLESRCQNCNQHQPVWATKARPGYCNACEQWLGFSPRTSSSEGSVCETNRSYDIWAARSVEELFNATSSFQALECTEHIRKSLSVVIDQFSASSITAFAKQVQLPIAQFYGWLSGQKRPQLETLLRLCYGTEIDLLKFLSGKVDPASLKHFNKPAKLRPRLVYSPRLYKPEHAALMLAVSEEPPPPLKEIAERLGHRDNATLYRIDRDLCKKIVSRYKAYLRRRRTQRVLKCINDTAEAMQIVNSALKENPPPSLREVARRLGYQQVLKLRERFPEQYVLLLGRKKEFERLQWASIYEMIEGTLNEFPPPSLHEISKRLKGKSINNIARRLPDLMRRVKDRHDEYRREYHVRIVKDEHDGYRRKYPKRIKSALEAALNEVPPPSLSRVAERLGFKHTYLLIKLYPELCLQLKAQRLKSRRLYCEAIKTSLNLILKETPPPCLNSISARLKIGLTILYRNYRKETRALTARYAEYRKKLSVQREKKLRSEIKRVVLQIVRNGLCPSSTRVASMLKFRLEIGERAIRAPLMAIRSELNLS